MATMTDIIIQGICGRMGRALLVRGQNMTNLIAVLI